MMFENVRVTTDLQRLVDPGVKDNGEFDVDVVSTLNPLINCEGACGLFSLFPGELRKTRHDDSRRR